jgi:hypothetical protein
VKEAAPEDTKHAEFQNAVFRERQRHRLTTFQRDGDGESDTKERHRSMCGWDLFNGEV